MEILEQIGSYAGLAAVVGLAVLSALYFSQARDVRRLREEASRRAVGPVPRAPAKVGQPQRTGAGPATAKPAAATAAAQPTAVASGQKPAGQTPAGQTAPAGAASGAAAAGAAGAAASGAPPGAPPKPPTGAPVTKPGGDGGAASPTKPPAGGDRPATGAAQAPSPTGAGARADAPQGAAGRAAPPRFPSQARPVGRQPRPGIGGPRERRPARQPWYRRLAPRYLVLIVAGVLIVGGGAAYGLVALLDEDVPAPTAESGDTGEKQQPGQAPVDPASVTVSVLNGTSVPGLAAQVGDTIESAGFQRGNVANATDQEAAESVILYVDGEARAARAVGRELDISQIQPIDSESQSLAGDAAVVVIVGADQTQSQ